MAFPAENRHAEMMADARQPEPTRRHGRAEDELRAARPGPYFGTVNELVVLLDDLGLSTREVQVHGTVFRDRTSESG